MTIDDQYVVHFEVCPRENTTLTGHDVTPREFIELTETMIRLGWPIAQEALTNHYRDALEKVLTALQHTVEFVGLETLKPQTGWSWFDTMTAYDPDRLKFILDGFASAADPPSAPGDVEWEGVSPARPFAVAVVELEKLRRLGRMWTGRLTDKELAWYEQHPMSHLDQNDSEALDKVIEWLKGKTS